MSVSPLPLAEAELSAALADLPPVSAVLQRTLAVLNNPHSELTDIARLVRTETVLAAQVLRLANSALFALPQPVGSIEEAIQRLGFAEVHRMVCALGSRQLFQRPLQQVGFSPEQLWRHTLAVAVAAEVVARLVRTDRSVAYLVGILHPVGIVVLDRVAQARGLAPRSAEQPLLEWEQGNFGTDNSSVAARVLRRWHFPDTLVATVGGRYLPGAAGEQLSAASVLHVASLLADKVGAGLPGEKGLFLPGTERLAAAGLRWDELGEAELETVQSLQRTQALLSLA